MASEDYGGAWFAQTRGGYRNKPVTWQGWRATLLYLLTLIGTLFLVPWGALAFGAGFVAATLAFALVAIRKSRPDPRHRLVRRS